MFATAKGNSCDFNRATFRGRDFQPARAHTSVSHGSVLAKLISTSGKGAGATFEPLANPRRDTMRHAATGHRMLRTYAVPEFAANNESGGISISYETEQAISRALHELQTPAWVLSKSTMKNIEAADYKNGVLINANAGLQLLSNHTVESLQKIHIAGQSLAQQHNTLMSGDEGCLLMQDQCDENAVKRQLLTFFATAELDNIWPELRQHCQWQELNGQPVISRAQLLPLALAFDQFALYLIHKVQSNSGIASLDKIYAFALTSCQRGGIEENMLDLIRESIVHNAKDIFLLQAKQVKQDAPEMHSVLKQAQEIFLLQVMIKMLRQAEQLLPAAFTDSPATPVDEVNDLSSDWLSADMCNAYQLFVNERSVHLCDIASQSISTVGLTSQDMPLLKLKSGCTASDIQSFIDQLVGDLLNDPQKLKLSQDLTKKIPGSSNMPQFVSLARLRNDLQHTFWLQVFLDSQVQNARKVAAQAHGRSFTFPEEVRAAIIANYGLVFQNAAHRMYSEKKCPALIVASDKFVNLSKRVMLACFQVGEREQLGNVSASLRHLIKNEYGESLLDGDVNPSVATDES